MYKTTKALVFLVMASSTKSILLPKSSGPMSTKTGLHPLRTKAFAVETKV